MCKRLVLVAFCFSILFTFPEPALAGNEMRSIFDSLGAGGLKGKKLEKAIKSAEAFPLGSLQNPVRENMPTGQHAYLSRLRCLNGSAPNFERAGNVGVGPYGYFIDLYRVKCIEADAVDVFMDMYHEGGELRPIPGFSIVAP